MAFDERVTLFLALALGVGCGLSTGHGANGDSASAGGNGTAGSDSGSGGTSSCGAATGGGSGSDGVGGDGNTGTRLFFQSSGALLASDFDGNELVELCPGEDDPGAYTLIGTEGDFTLVSRDRCSTAGETSILRVARDGSRCSVVYSAECNTTFGGSTIQALSPIVSGRVVFSLLPPNLELAPYATGLASVRTDGSGYEVIAVEGVGITQLVGGRVVFYYRRTASDAFEVHTACADGTDRKPLIPSSLTQVFVTAGTRLIVDSYAQHGVVAVDPDGGRLVELAVGPSSGSTAGLAGDHVVIRRRADLYAVPINGGELVPLATTAEDELFEGASGDRIVYNAPWGDVFSVKLDGSDTQPIARTAREEFVSDIEGDRVLLFRASGTEPILYDLVSAAIDGSDTVTLVDGLYGGMPTLVGDRAITGSFQSTDLMSFSAMGGDPVVLAASGTYSSIVGRIGSTLIIQTEWDGEIVRIEADGSDRRVLLPSGTYVGAITERCGVLPTDSNFRAAPCIEP
jgi:hypothetical protein